MSGRRGDISAPAAAIHFVRRRNFLLPFDFASSKYFTCLLNAPRGHPRAALSIANLSRTRPAAAVALIRSRSFGEVGALVCLFVCLSTSPSGRRRRSHLSRLVCATQRATSIPGTSGGNNEKLQILPSSPIHQAAIRAADRRRSRHESRQINRAFRGAKSKGDQQPIKTLVAFPILPPTSQASLAGKGRKAGWSTPARRLKG